MFVYLVSLMQVLQEKVLFQNFSCFIKMNQKQNVSFVISIFHKENYIQSTLINLIDDL